MVAVVAEKTSNFFPLTCTDWVNMTRNLTPSQLKVLYYVRALAGPYERKLKLKINDIADELGLNRSTVSRCLKKLDEKGLIDIELIEINSTIKMPAYDWKTSTYAPCDRTIASPDQTIASPDQTIAHPIYIDRARAEDLKEVKDSPLTPQVDQSRGGEIEQQTAAGSVADLLASMQDQINSLREAMNMGRGNLSTATVQFHQKSILVENNNAPVEFHQEDIVVQADRAPVQVCQEDIAVRANYAPVEFHQKQIEVDSPGSPVSFHQKNITVSTYPPGLEHLPLPILKRIVDLGIPLDNQVIALLNEVHISQINGALNHIEESFDTIKSTKAVFLFKAPKMPVEKSVLYPVFRAEDQPQIEVAPIPDSIRQQIAAIVAKKEREKQEKLRQALGE